MYGYFFFALQYYCSPPVLVLVRFFIDCGEELNLLFRGHEPRAYTPWLHILKPIDTGLRCGSYTRRDYPGSVI